MPYWDERVEMVVLPQCYMGQIHIDILTAHFVQHPDWFDVVVASNLFGDILSDLSLPAPVRLALHRPATLTLREIFHHCSNQFTDWPDIAGKGIANPVGQIWAGAMMLEHLGFTEAATHYDRCHRHRSW